MEPKKGSFETEYSLLAARLDDTFSRRLTTVVGSFVVGTVVGTTVVEIDILVGV